MTGDALYSVAVTAIIERDGKYLITKRTPIKRRWPNRWTVPGGRLEPSDYQDLPEDAEHEWYNILERVVRREVHEEVGVSIADIEYLTSIVVHHPGGVPPGLVISLAARYAGGDVAPDPDEVSAVEWVTPGEAHAYNLIGDIYGEIIMAEERCKGVRREWQPRATDAHTK